jgi:succinoglycan biosynthesis transport protein ExoP
MMVQSRSDDAPNTLRACADGTAQENDVPISKCSLDYILANLFPLLWRRRTIVFVGLLISSFAAFAFYAAVGERYEVYTLLRVGQGIKDRTSDGNGNSAFGEGVDLMSRIDSVARIGTTDHVISEAINKVGLTRLFSSDKKTLLLQARARLDELLGRPPRVPDAQQMKVQAIVDLRDRISARQEGRSDLLRLSFRHPDPAVAVEFLNELANSLAGAQAGLVQVPGADEFFQEQARRLEGEAEKAAAELKDFSVAASIYAVADQRGLLLKRANDLAGLMATTRASIEEKKGQKQVIVDQLRVMRPVYQSKTVTGMVNDFAGRQDKSKEDKVKETVASTDETPPVLLVKIYQDAMANLLKINSDLKGSLNLESSLAHELDSVNAQLADLTSKEAEYDRLKRVLARASSAAEYYGTRMMEAQINLESAKKSQLSNVRVVQLPYQPIDPVFPRIRHLVMLALAGGIGLGSAFALLLEIAKLSREHQEDMHRLMVSKLALFPRRNPLIAAE